MPVVIAHQEHCALIIDGPWEMHSVQGIQGLSTARPTFCSCKPEYYQVGGLVNESGKHIGYAFALKREDKEG